MLLVREITAYIVPKNGVERKEIAVYTVRKEVMCVTRRELIDLCLSYGAVYEDYPFDLDPTDPEAWTLVRHVGNKKTFAFIYERNGLCLNLKCDPLRAEFLRQVYEAVLPGYHLNKTHWNTVYVDRDVPMETLEGMIRESFELTRPKVRGKKKEY